jgi:hypothetical protein
MMKTKTGTWFEVGVRHSQTQEDGTEKKVTDRYLVNALSFTEAEAIAIQHQSEYSTDFAITSESQTSYNELILSNEEDTTFFKAKIAFITINEKTGKEKATKIQYLVEAPTISEALHNIGEALKGIMDYRVYSITKTRIIEIIEKEK